jgi:succinate dehydrogenase / fumarate reductase flavoprotein subunit
MPALTAESDAERREQAKEWCDRFDENNARWLKTTIAECRNGDPEITYEDVDTSMIPPRPRLYGLAGAEVIEEVWKERMEIRASSAGAEAPETSSPQRTESQEVQ